MGLPHDHQATGEDGVRILGFTQRWDKLSKPVHTTFRFQRKDKDWQVGEIVQEVYKPRSKEREFIQLAEITSILPMQIYEISHQAAIEDGFNDLGEMHKFLKFKEITDLINKITLKVVTHDPN